MAGRPRDLIWTLVRREISTRFGPGAVAYIWALVVPLSWIGFGILAFAFFDRKTPLSAEPALFLATGILPYVVFRQTLISVTRAATANRALLHLPGVCLPDLIIAYALLEGLTTAVIVVLVLTSVTWVVSGDWPNLFFETVFLFATTWILAVALSILTTLVSERMPSVGRILPLVLRPLFWISGVFFVASELPPIWQDLLSWNPLFLLIDGVRAAYFHGYISPVYSASSVFWVLGCTLTCALLLLLGRVRSPQVRVML
ncbi:MAG: ABC transporter permease [Pseudomonadota bacterium]